MLKDFFSNGNNEALDEQIDVVLIKMKQSGVLSEEYPTLMTYLERLSKIKADIHQAPVSRDTIALIAGNLLGVLLIVAYEQKHVMTSQGFKQVIRPR